MPDKFTKDEIRVIIIALELLQSIIVISSLNNNYDIDIVNNLEKKIQKIK